MSEPRDRTAEVKAASGRLEIARDDVCDAFEQDADRLFSNYECWYCKYGDFGVLTEHPLITGVCKLKVNKRHFLSYAKRREDDPAVQASKKQEEETK